MSIKYTFSHKFPTLVTPLPGGVFLIEEETFTAVEFDSFDEARNAVNKGVSERKKEVMESRGTKIEGLGKKDEDTIIHEEDDLPPLEGTHQPEKPL